MGKPTRDELQRWREMLEQRHPLPMMPESVLRLIDRVEELEALASEASLALHMERKRCGCWGKMFGSCPSCKKRGELERRLGDAAIADETKEEP